MRSTSSSKIVIRIFCWNRWLCCTLMNENMKKHWPCIWGKIWACIAITASEETKRGLNGKNSLHISHRLQHKDVFKLIKKHNLYDVIYKSIVPLIQLDSEQAISMLLERNKIPADVVVSQLQNHEEYLYLVRLKLFEKWRKKAIGCRWFYRRYCFVVSFSVFSFSMHSIKLIIRDDFMRNWFTYTPNTIETNCCHF